MIRDIHHPSCPAGGTARGVCICPKPRRRHDVVVEAVAFAAMLAAMVSLPLYLLWRAAA